MNEEKILKVTDLTSKVVGSISLKVDNDAILSTENLDVHSYLVVKAENANLRSNSAHTKTRGEVRGGGRKIRPQKGTGFARQSSTRAPHRVGGGVVFGPRNDRNFEQKVNKKLRRRVLGSLIWQNLDNFVVIQDCASKYKTKDMSKFFVKPGFFIHSIFESSQSVSNLSNLLMQLDQTMLCRNFFFKKHTTMYVTVKALEYLCSQSYIIFNHVN